MDTLVTCPVIPVGMDVEKALTDWSVGGAEALDTVDLPVYRLVVAATG